MYLVAATISIQHLKLYTTSERNDCIILHYLETRDEQMNHEPTIQF